MNSNSIPPSALSVKANALRIQLNLLRDPSLDIRVRVKLYYESIPHTWSWISPASIGLIIDATAEQVTSARKKLVASNELESERHHFVPGASTKGAWAHKYKVPAKPAYPVDEAYWLAVHASYPNLKFEDTTTTKPSDIYGSKTVVPQVAERPVAPVILKVIDPGISTNTRVLADDTYVSDAAWDSLAQDMQAVLTTGNITSYFNGANVLALANSVCGSRSDAAELLHKMVVGRVFDRSEFTNARVPAALLKSKMREWLSAPAAPVTVPSAEATPVSVAPETVRPVPTVSDAAKHSDRHASMDTSKYLAEAKFRKATKSAGV